MGNGKISESEWLIMNELWEKSPLTARQIVEGVQREKDYAETTIKTLLRRLIAKNAVSFTIDSKNKMLYYYSSVSEQRDCVSEENRRFLSIYHQNDLIKLFESFLMDAALSNDEIDSLKQLLELKRSNAK